MTVRFGIAPALVAALALTAGCGVQEQATPRNPSLVRFHDPDVGLSGEYPGDWHRAKALTNLGDPREVLSLASYPLRGGDKAGECAPRTALADLPGDGAFVWLIEYRPSRGDVWADFPRSRFPLKPEHFELRRSDLEPDLYCHSGPGHGTTFRAADRPFQLFLAFGKGVTDERLAQVEAILNNLSFDTVPAPPRDPYAGWPLINDNPGDSLRPPPGWPGAAVTFPPGNTSRPRLLFFASNRPLWGLPTKLVAHMGDPAPDNQFPTGALANEFPSDGVLLFVLEEASGGPSAEFPAIGRGWPARDDFSVGEIATQAAPGLRWLRAGGSFSGYRFSVWIGRAPQASNQDLRLALKSAASLAVSGCWRDRYDDCPDQ